MKYFCPVHYIQLMNKYSVYKEIMALLLLKKQAWFNLYRCYLPGVAWISRAPYSIHSENAREGNVFEKSSGQFIPILYWTRLISQHIYTTYVYYIQDSHAFIDQRRMIQLERTMHKYKSINSDQIKYILCLMKRLTFICSKYF